MSVMEPFFAKIVHTLFLAKKNLEAVTEVLCKKKVFLEICKFHRKTTVLECLF